MLSTMASWVITLTIDLMERRLSTTLQSGVHLLTAIQFIHSKGNSSIFPGTKQIASHICFVYFSRLFSFYRFHLLSILYAAQRIYSIFHRHAPDQAFLLHENHLKANKFSEINNKLTELLQDCRLLYTQILLPLWIESTMNANALSLNYCSSSAKSRARSIFVLRIESLNVNRFFKRRSRKCFPCTMPTSIILIRVMVKAWERQWELQLF